MILRFVCPNLNLEKKNIANSMSEVTNHHGNISVQMLPQICTLHIVKWGKSGVDIKMTKNDEFQNFSIKSDVVDVY